MELTPARTRPLPIPEEMEFAPLSGPECERLRQYERELSERRGTRHVVLVLHEPEAVVGRKGGATMTEPVGDPAVPRARLSLTPDGVRLEMEMTLRSDCPLSSDEFLVWATEQFEAGRVWAAGSEVTGFWPAEPMPLVERFGEAPWLPIRPRPLAPPAEVATNGAPAEEPAPPFPSPAEWKANREAEERREREVARTAARLLQGAPPPDAVPVPARFSGPAVVTDAAFVRGQYGSTGVQIWERLRRADHPLRYGDLIDRSAGLGEYAVKRVIKGFMADGLVCEERVKGRGGPGGIARAYRLAARPEAVE